MSSPTVSVQLYSVRGAVEVDPAGTIDRLAAAGFTDVEAGYKYLAAHAELLPAIHRNGLATPTMTASLVGCDRASAWEMADRLGAETVVETFVPAEHWGDLDGVGRIADEMNAAAQEAAERGLRVGYHNHWWEIETRFGGTSALDHLVDCLDPRVVLEVDAYWVAVGGADPVDLVARHAERVRFLHVKDGPISRDNSAQRPAGRGVLPIPALLGAATALEAAVVEFDDYDGDVFEAVAQSRAHLASLVEVAA